MRKFDNFNTSPLYTIKIAVKNLTFEWLLKIIVIFGYNLFSHSMLNVLI